MESPDYTVYVLQNPSGRLYIGLSADVEDRIRQHNAGISKWTRTRGPWVGIWRSGGHTLSAALHLEKDLKRQKGGTGLFRILGIPRPSKAGP